MFTGLIKHVGKITAITLQDDKGQLAVVIPTDLVNQVSIGDSIAINGCCLTLEQIDNNETGIFSLGPETIARTSPFIKDHQVHLEPSLRVGDTLGGHFVLGHVDGVVTVDSIQEVADSIMVTFKLDQKLNPLLVVEKGSVTIAGVSLTVVSTNDDLFDVQLIKHTIATTLLNTKQMLVIGNKLNFEADIFARHALHYQSIIGK